MSNWILMQIDRCLKAFRDQRGNRNSSAVRFEVRIPTLNKTIALTIAVVPFFASGIIHFFVFRETMGIVGEDRVLKFFQHLYCGLIPDAIAMLNSESWTMVSWLCGF